MFQMCKITIMQQKSICSIQTIKCYNIIMVMEFILNFLFSRSKNKNIN